MKHLRRREDGIALLISMMVMLMMTALGFALILTTSGETMIAGNYRNAYEGSYAADAVLERAMGDLLTVADWNIVLNGSVQSAFIDGDSSGPRTLPGGTALDLGQTINMANCQRVTTCSDSDMNAVTTERPWGTNNPRWQLYAYGNLADMLPTHTINSLYYVIVMVGDDPSENDGDPLHDGMSQTNPGSGVISLRAEAFGPRGSHKVIELTVARTGTTEMERDDVGQRGQDEQNGHARQPAAATPGVRVLSWREVR